MPNTKNEFRLLLSVKDTADALGVGLTTTWGLIKSGQLKTRNIGRRCLVTVTSINEFVAKAENSDAKDAA
jgi:hypothetical protein